MLQNWKDSRKNFVLLSPETSAGQCKIDNEVSCIVQDEC